MCRLVLCSLAQRPVPFQLLYSCCSELPGLYLRYSDTNPCTIQIYKKTDALDEVQQQFKELKDDFLYNEGVLQERDDEIRGLESQLQKSSASHASVRKQLHDSQVACSAAQSQLLIERDQCAASPFNMPYCSEHV